MIAAAIEVFTIRPSARPRTVSGVDRDIFSAPFSRPRCRPAIHAARDQKPATRLDRDRPWPGCRPRRHVGPQASFLSERFGTKVRYSGVSLGYNLASIFAGRCRRSLPLGS
jgi:hypothetical protein